jgi:hypothetical protein
MSLRDAPCPLWVNSGHVKRRSGPRFAKNRTLRRRVDRGQCPSHYASGPASPHFRSSAGSSPTRRLLCRRWVGCRRRGEAGLTAPHRLQFPRLLNKLSSLDFSLPRFHVAFTIERFSLRARSSTARATSLDFVGLTIGAAQRSEVIEYDMNSDIWLARGQRGLPTHDTTLRSRPVYAILGGRAIRAWFAR